MQSRTLASNGALALLIGFALMQAGEAMAARSSRPMTIQGGRPSTGTGRAPQEVDRIGGSMEALPAAKALQDTIWIADWTFDPHCSQQWWAKRDNRILNDGVHYWSVGMYPTPENPLNNAAILSNHNLCWPTVNGYGNNWDQSIRLEYKGASTLSFAYELDSEPGWDEMRVEADSAAASFLRVDYATNPGGTPDHYRMTLYLDSGFDHESSVVDLALPDFNAPNETHAVYIRFKSNARLSSEDTGDWSTLGAALIVDDVVVMGGVYSYLEDFEDLDLNPNLTFMNTAPDRPFGEWAQLYPHITDNDRCTENATCAWLFTDPMIWASDASMAFGPGANVVHNWLDDIIESPWVDLTSTPNLTQTLLSYRVFGGNEFFRGHIVLNTSVRGLLTCDNTDTSTPGDVVQGIGPWDNPWWYSCESFTWRTQIEDLTPYLSQYLAPEPEQIQVRFRVSDWQYLTGTASQTTSLTGPGPYIDRVRIGRRVRSPGPLLRLDPDSRALAQDAFPSEIWGGGGGEHFVPGADRFGTCALSSADDLGQGWSPNLITGDSIVIEAMPERGVLITGVSLYGWIVAGPHTGKAPAPWVVGAGGAFHVPGEQVVIPVSEVLVMNKWCVDLDDTYFRGGDVLHYIWLASDQNGMSQSYPPGLSAPPTSHDQAAAATSGLLEVSFLPSVVWDPGYLARIAADEHGDLEPTPSERDNSSQQHCILYVQQVNQERRSGDLNRTSFMYTLDNLGYRGHYDVYDDGGVNTWLGGRASVTVGSGYGLIIQDCGRTGWVASGGEYLWNKIDQAGWYQSYLSQGLTSLAGRAGLWLLGENVAKYLSGTSLLGSWMGARYVHDDQGLLANPDVVGVAAFTFASGCTGPFQGDRFSLKGGCPNLRNYDALGAEGTGVVTHRYAEQAQHGDGAIVMNKVDGGGYRYDSVISSFNWFDIAPTAGVPVAPIPQRVLASKILNCVLAAPCVQGGDPTDNGDQAPDGAPLVNALHANVPNPFNPTTVMPFDVALAGHTRLVVYDVSGRLMRTLVDEVRPAGRYQQAWDGRADSGELAASGVYFVRLQVGDAVISRRIVLLR